MLAALNVYSSEGIAYGYFHTTVLHKFLIYHLELDGSLGYIFNNQQFNTTPGHLAPILGSKLHSRLVGSKLAYFKQQEVTRVNLEGGSSVPVVQI